MSATQHNSDDDVPKSNLYDLEVQKNNRAKIPNLNRFIGQDGEKYDIQVSPNDYRIFNKKGEQCLCFSFNSGAPRDIHLIDEIAGYHPSQPSATFFDSDLNERFAEALAVLSKASGPDGTTHNAIVSHDLMDLFRRAIAAREEMALASAQPPGQKAANVMARQAILG